MILNNSLDLATCRKPKLLRLFWISFLLISSWGCVNETYSNGSSTIAIIPQPNSVKTHHGEFRFGSQIQILSNSTFDTASSYLKEYLTLIGVTVDLNSQAGAIRFIEDQTITNDEGYELRIYPKGIEIKAKTAAGAFYAVQSLCQLLPHPKQRSKQSKITIPAVEVKDAPEFGYRGMHLDVSRHFFPPNFIKKYIDALAMLKMNVFHWHLTDDQGWRIEIKQFPKLQSVAAYRAQTLIGHYNNQPHQFDGQPYGGFYSQQEVKDIVSYAQKKHITIIPEIEMPGHSQAAIAAYPFLSCETTPIDVAQKWGVFETIYCTKEPVFEFLEGVLSEVVSLFPGPYIHIGGDEAQKIKWQQCNECQQRMKDENLADTKALQSYFIQRIERYVNKKGKQIIGWDEILEGGLAENATVMSWRGFVGAIEAAKQGHQVIMTPTSHCYFDYYQSDHNNEPLAIGGFLPLEKVYSFNPIPSELSDQESEFILGAQGNIWTEYMSTSTQVEYMMFPRVLALSEALWTKSELKNYEIFSVKAEKFHNRLKGFEYHPANHFYDISGKLISTNNGLYFNLTKPSKNYDIFYTTDNTPPKFSKSHQYKGPIQIFESTIINAITYNKNGTPLGYEFTEKIDLHKGVGQQISLDKLPNAAYSGLGAKGLINGISGSDSRYGDKEWLGFWGDDVTITITLDSPVSLNSISTRFFEAQGQWIFAPKKVTIEIMDSSGTLVTVGELKALLSHAANDGLTIEKSIDLGGLQTEVIKLTVENFGIIPEGKQGAGQRAWTFIDEIKIL